jgi:hypothetical protein
MFVDLVKRVGEVFIDLLPAVLDALGDFGSAVWDFLGGWVDTFLGFFTGLPGMVWEGIKALPDTVKGVLEDVGGFFLGLKDDVVGFIGEIVNAVIGLPGRLGEMLGDIASAALDIGTAIIGGIADGIADAVGVVVDIGKQIIQTVIDWLNVNLIDFINNFKLDIFGKKIDLVPVSIPQIPDIISLPGAQFGALVTGGAGGVPIVVGEGRKNELIAPLPDGVIEGLQAIADGRFGGGQPMVMNVHQIVAPEPRRVPHEIVTRMRAEQWLLGVA